MFSKTIFKQTIKANWGLWVIFTVILNALLVLIIAAYDPDLIAKISSALEGTAMASMAGDQLANMTTLLGNIGTSFYGNMVIILPLIFIIITANKLVASEVDRGSMAYTLSTPIKRKAVVFTKAIALIGSLILMFSILTGTGILATQATHGAVWGTNYTSDVKAVADKLGKSNADVANDLSLILTNPEALKTGAKARDMDVDVYTMYLGMAMQRNSGTKTQEPAMSEEAKAQIQNQMVKGLTAASNVLDMSVSDLSEDMNKIKESDTALTAAINASGLPKEAFITIINQQIASNELTKDVAITFNVADFVMLNVGCFLLLLAISGISFLASCAANLTKHSLAFGAGIPIAFFIFQIITKTGDSLKVFKYFTLNTLFESAEIASGKINALPLIILGMIGVVLYFLAIRIFTRKDLPL